jgi:hypothetical protein
VTRGLEGGIERSDVGSVTEDESTEYQSTRRQSEIWNRSRDGGRGGYEDGYGGGEDGRYRTGCCGRRPKAAAAPKQRVRTIAASRRRTVIVGSASHRVVGHRGVAG